MKTYSLGDKYLSPDETATPSMCAVPCKLHKKLLRQVPFPFSRWQVRAEVEITQLMLWNWAWHPEIKGSSGTGCYGLYRISGCSDPKALGWWCWHSWGLIQLCGLGGGPGGRSFGLQKIVVLRGWLQKPSWAWSLSAAWFICSHELQHGHQMLESTGPVNLQI